MNQTETFTYAIELVKRCELIDCGQLKPEEATQAMKKIILGTLEAHKNLEGQLLPHVIEEEIS